MFYVLLTKNANFTNLLYQNLCVIFMSANTTRAFVLFSFLPVGNNLLFLSSPVKKEDEDLEDKKSIKKRIKELKVLDSKIAQNLCKYLFLFRQPLLPMIGFSLYSCLCFGYVNSSSKYA